ncbi:ATP-binding protein [Pelagibius sp. Alg239-R121]|uniref:ATP-binding protein n=1 Tax=Pelagibius sp. Alg239-R121 TaxID=2993448 RepID=UPI0024A6BCA5|nr:ATP-binding protein [Pelagibius sp. Alg239-R121]
MKRLWPQSLAGQMIALLLLALVVSHIVSAVIFEDERRASVRSAVREEAVTAIATATKLLLDTPEADRKRVVRQISSRRLRYWLSSDSVIGSDRGLRPADKDRALLYSLLEAAVPEIRVAMTDRPRFFRWAKHQKQREKKERRHDEWDHGDDDGRAHGHGWPGPPGFGLLASIQLPDGMWLNAATVVPGTATAWQWPALVSMIVMALLIALIVVLMARRMARPMTRLASAADRFGRGEDFPPLPIAGPPELRRTTQAFNAMRTRLKRFVEDRTRLLAAVSHDLRTPITSLRLRAEFIENEEVREKMIETLDEMERITDATLAFAREEAVQEDTRTVDISALVESLCDDLRDLGKDVDCRQSERLPYACRPVGLKRALRNVIENAVSYGERARVRIEQRPDNLLIVIEDDGPGIPENAFERVFAPFERLEESRNRETGGIGLGLAIARSIIRSHGGDITLFNRSEGGLTVTVSLPSISEI